MFLYLMLFVSSVASVSPKIYNRDTCTKSEDQMTQKTDSNDHTYIESPHYDGKSKPVPSLDCKDLYDFHVNPGICCRLHILNLDIDFEHDLLEMRDKFAQKKAYFNFTSDDLIGSVLPLTPNTIYSFHYKTAGNSEHRGFKFDVSCTNCSLDKLQGKSFCFDRSLSMSTPDQQEMYIQTPNFTFGQTSASHAHFQNCSMTLTIHKGLCCNLVNIYHTLGGGDMKMQNMSIDSSEPWPSIENFSTELEIDTKIYSYVYGTLVGGQKYKIVYTPDSHKAINGSQYRLSCIWCTKRSPKPSHSSLLHDDLTIALIVICSTIGLILLTGCIYIGRVQYKKRNRISTKPLPLEMGQNTSDYFTGLGSTRTSEDPRPPISESITYPTPSMVQPSDDINQNLQC